MLHYTQEYSDIMEATEELLEITLRLTCLTLEHHGVTVPTGFEHMFGEELMDFFDSVGVVIQHPERSLEFGFVLLDGKEIAKFTEAPIILNTNGKYHYIFPYETLEA